MKQSYQRFLAATLCAVMVLSPVTVFADGTVPMEAPGQEAALQEPQDNEWISDEPADAPALPAEGEAIPEENESGEDARMIDPEAAGQAGEQEGEAQPEAPADPNAVQLVFDQQPMVMNVSAQMGQGVTWVPVRSFFEAMGCTVVWNQAKSTIQVTLGDVLNMELKLGDRLLQANGRCWYMSDPCTTIQGNAMIPVRDAAKVFSAQVQWDGATQTVSLTGGPLLESGENYYNQEDLFWIARIVQCEAGNQSLDGKVGVANVVINRMNDSGFPSTAKEVIYDHRNGVQFVPLNSKRILNDPTEQSWLAAKLALEGYETAPGCFYFVTLKAAKKSWAGRNRTYYGSIGNHAFYK